MSQYINEAFKKFKLLEDFEEFSMTPEGLDNLGSFIGQAMDDEQQNIDVIDLEAEAVEDLKQSYVGKVICDCNVCHSNIFYNKEDIVIDDEGIVNIEDECPYCMSTEGYTIIGEIKPWDPGLEQEIDDELSDEADEPIEVEDEEETEVVEEGLHTKKLRESAEIGSDDDLFSGKPIKSKFTVASAYVPPYVDEEDEEEELRIKLKVVEFEDGGFGWYEIVNGEEGMSNRTFDSIEKAIKNYKTIAKNEYGSDIKFKILSKYASMNEAYAVDIDWDTDGEDVDLPTRVKLPAGIDDEDVADYLSDTYGWLVNGCYIEDNLNEAIEDDDLQLDSTNHRITRKSSVKQLPNGKWLGIGPQGHKEFINKKEAEKYSQHINESNDDLQLDSTNHRITRKSSVKQLPNGKWLGTGSQGHKEFATKKEAEKYSQHVNESIEDVTINTEDETMTMTTKEDGGVMVETSPKVEDEFVSEEEIIETPENISGDEIIAPISDETEEEIMNNSDEEDEDVLEMGDENAPIEDTEDIAVDEFDEDTFDELGESYLRKCYDNVKGYKTTQVRVNENLLTINGVITFKSGNKKKTSFVFESKTKKNNKFLFEGFNKQLNNGTKAFKLTCGINNKKIISEKLRYNYSSKNALNESVKISGIVKVKR